MLTRWARSTIRGQETDTGKETWCHKPWSVFLQSEMEVHILISSKYSFASQRIKPGKRSTPRVDVQVITSAIAAVVNITTHSISESTVISLDGIEN